jgi:CHASE2 domain-containing sensor protein
MSKLVILKLDGDLQQQGFRVTLEIGEENARPDVETFGSLPALPDLANYLIQWQGKYSSLVINNSRIKPKKMIYGGSINSRVNECNHFANKLKICLQSWLNAEEFRGISNTLREELNRDEVIRVLIRTDDIQLQQLPWHLWDFFDNYTKAEFAISTIAFQKKEKPRSKARVRILAILGNSSGIDIETDRKLLESLPDAETVFLQEPQRNELNQYLWQQWDMLFFAGHSETNNDTGEIYINQTDSLTIAELKFALESAIAQGLQLAIFNSCDGLGLAWQLSLLNIPQIIVMREPVPDKVAQEFLKQFLVAFADGKSLYLASREAREKLQGLEDKFPNATWLPVIFQNPAVTPPRWRDFLTAKIDESHTASTVEPLPQRKLNLLRLLGASLAIAASVMGVRYLGILQKWELQTYDQLMRIRPDEGSDRRLLIVGITDEDFQLPEQKERKGSLSDLALDKLLEKIEPYKPRAIGLDIFRDFPVEAKQISLKTRLQKSNNFFAICQVGEPGGADSGISHPPEIPQANQGFSNVIPDTDGILRRHLLSMDVPSTSICQTPISLSLQLALRYLKDDGIVPKITQGNWQLGNVIFRRLQSPVGGYQMADTWGNQVLLNYRSYHSPLEIADVVTLTDILKNKVKPEIVQNRIVLIGVMTRTSGDQFPTPYSEGGSSYQEMPGVILHAQMISQILSAVLDGRPLIGVWTVWGELIWVWGWSVIGGVLAWRFRTLPLHGILGGGVAFGVLYGLCFWLLIQGSWIPLVPSALALFITAGSMVVLIRNS